MGPLRYGADVKGEIGDSLIRGVPGVTTPVGAERFGAVTETLVSADAAMETATKIIALHQYAAKWASSAGAVQRLREKDPDRRRQGRTFGWPAQFATWVNGGCARVPCGPPKPPRTMIVR